jgi:hypothetical protein
MESAKQERKNLMNDMPIVNRASGSWMSKHSRAAVSPVEMGGSGKMNPIEMGGKKSPMAIDTDPKSGKKTKIQPFKDPGAPKGFVPTFGEDVVITGSTGVLQGRQTFSGPKGRNSSPNVTTGGGKNKRPAEFRGGDTTTHDSVRRDGNNIVPTTTRYTFDKTKKSPTPGTVYKDFQEKKKYDTDTPYRSEQLTFKKYDPKSGR